MKKHFLIVLGAVLLSGFTILSYSQGQIEDNLGTYVKTNIAVTKFKILGVTQKQYAKCLETENFFEPEKNLKFLLIDKTSFADDGQGYDLKAGDGILTSSQLFPYTGNNYVQQGGYRESPEHNAILAHEDFAYLNHTGVMERFSIKIGCKVKWVTCDEMPPQAARFCNSFGWPYGTLRLVECDFSFEL